MSLESDVTSGAHAAAQPDVQPAAAPVAAGNPALLGLITFLPSGFTLGLARTSAAAPCRWATPW